MAQCLLVFVWSELNIDVLRDSCRHHTLLAVLDLEVGRIGWQDVKSLWGLGVVNEADLLRVGPGNFVAAEPHYCWTGRKYAVSAHRIIGV